MKSLISAIVASVVTMVVVLFLLDLKQIFVTPLTPYGANHWIPELVGIFLIGKLLTQINRKLIPIIVGCVFAYPIITYSLVQQMSFGIGTGSIFTAVLLMGIWSEKMKEVK